MSMRFKFFNPFGYSLIELQMAIAIVAMLASMGVSGYNVVVDRVKTKLTDVTLKQIHKYIGLRRTVEDSRRLIQLTGNSCSNCAIRGSYMKNVQAQFPANDVKWAAIGFSDKAPLDGWGNPIFFDENEGEWGPADCRNDIFESAGPDGIFYNADDFWLCGAFVNCQGAPMTACLFAGYVGRGRPPF